MKVNNTFLFFFTIRVFIGPTLPTNLTLKRTQIDPHTQICLCFRPPLHTHTGLPPWVIFLPSVWSLFSELHSRPWPVIRPAAFLSTHMFVVLAVSEGASNLIYRDGAPVSVSAEPTTREKKRLLV